MATPQTQLNLSRVLEPSVPVPRRRPAAPALKLDRVLEPTAPRAATQPRATPALAVPDVDPRLDDIAQQVIARASELSGGKYSYKLGSGGRTPDEQAALVSGGFSRTQHSKHLSGRGRDLNAFEGGNYITNGRHEAYNYIGQAIRELNPPGVQWGGNWKTFYDPSHLELTDGDDSDAPTELNLARVLEPIGADDDGPPERIEAATDRVTGVALALDDPRRTLRPDATEAAPQEIAPRPLPQRQSFDVRTQVGRGARDARHATERKAGAFLELDVPLPAGGARDWSEVTGDAAVRAGVSKFAASRGIPSEFVERWMKDNASTGYSMRDREGKEISPAESINADTYSPATRTLRVKLDSAHLSKLEDDYKASKGVVSRAADYVTDDETSPGEKLLGVVTPPAKFVVEKGARGLDLATRPLQAIDAGFWAKMRGAHDIIAAKAAYDQFFGEHPELGKNIVAEALKDSDRLKAINPRLPVLLGELANVVLEPSNLIPLGAAGKLLKGGEEAGALGRIGARVGEGAREVGLLDRGFVKRNPLGLDVGETAAKVAGDAPVSELLTHARGRLLAYEQEAANASNPLARQNALAVAEDYRHEVARLESGESLNLDNVLEPLHHSHTQPRETCGRFVPDEGMPLDAFVNEHQPSLLRRGARGVADVVQLPKAKAGFDLSATGRQGLAQIMAHPTYFKEAMGRQVRAFASEDAANSFVEAIRSRPDFDLLSRHVDLSSTGGITEEAFASGLVKKIPGIRASDRAYSAAVDSIRVQAWDNYTRAVAGNPRVNEETYKAIGELINISTGRGRVPILDRSELGRKVINALNVPFFSPRNTASKFNLISPLRVARNVMNPATRPVAWLQMRDASRGLAVFGTTLGLMHVAGLDVGLNPFKPEFGKLRVGKAVYDLTGGESASVRYMAQMAQTFRDIEHGQKPKVTPGQLTARYLRSQLQPSAAVAVDKATGETFDRQPFTYSQAAADLVVPFVVADAYKGWVAAGGSTIEEIDDAGTRGDFLEGDFSKVHTGFKGAATATPGIFGAGVNYYDKPEDYEADKESRTPQPTGAVAAEGKRLNLVVPSLPKNISTERLTGDSVKIHTKNGEQLAGLSDEEYARMKAEYASEMLSALDETISNPDYKSFETDDDRRAHLDFVMKGVRARFLAGQRLGARERQADELQKLEETQRRLEARPRNPNLAVKMGFEPPVHPAPLNLSRVLER